MHRCAPRRAGGGPETVARWHTLQGTSPKYLDPQGVVSTHVRATSPSFVARWLAGGSLPAASRDGRRLLARSVLGRSTQLLVGLGQAMGQLLIDAGAVGVDQ